MRKIKINSASISPGRYEHQVDEEFLQDVSSIITLEDGSSLNLEKTVLLYNPDTKKIQLSDSDTIPENFIQLATLTLTQERPEVVNDEPFEEPSPEGEEVEPETKDNSTEGENQDDDEFFI